MVYLGLDVSTQQLKIVATDESLQNVVGSWSVHYDDELPSYNTTGGVHTSADGKTVTSPTIMWVEALDLVLQKMQSSGFDFQSVKSVSGAGQQHGSVYWSSIERLKSLDEAKLLKDQLKDTFALNDSPIWMDASTDLQMQQLEEAVGGPEELCKITGSRAYHRFTGTQIAKMKQQNLSAYENSARISLVSSAVCSILAGIAAPIDWADGSGMNLLDIRSRCWHEGLMNTAGGKDVKWGLFHTFCRILD